MQPSKYRQLFKELRQQILDAVFTAGNPFPSESALAREKGLTRNTVHRAYLELRRQGLVEGNPGEPPRLTRRAVRRKIGLVVRGTSYSEFFQPIVGEISMLAQRKGYSILFGNTAADNPVRLARDAMALAQNLVDCGASGVILQPFEFVRNSTELNAAMLAVFAAAEVPVVLIDYDAVQPPGRTACDLVGINNFQAGWRLADHLLAAGARQIDFVLRPDCAWSVHGRLDGVRAAVARAGMPPVRVLSAAPDDSAALRRHLRKGRPDAFVCGNDTLAAQVKQTLENAGLKIPDDILLAGFDDVQIAALLTPPLTTIHQPCREIGAKAFSLLLRRMRNPQSSALEVFLPAPLVVRASTCRPRTG